ncbi:3-deoxy-D-manno-octulosonic acid transferase [Nibricoccus sp. IMCC34717]|uniref:3-deoxy-D-manno-octulosonic acid transferase n=1 Tax=Nibricoccus sp. IMCC34717 TaxID=3034021 RepID=UPI00384AF11A
MLWLYRIAFLPALLLALPYYVWRMVKRGGYREGFAERFGRVPALPPKQRGRSRIWLQAVSVGEVLAAAPLVEALLARPDVEIYLTTTTSTGRRLAKEKFGGRVLAVAAFPTDFWLFSRRTWAAVQPDVALLLEGERWPEHLAQARGRRVPLVAVNARLSDRSFRRMQQFRGALAPLWAGYSRVLAASELDADRFRQLGFAADTVRVTGNLKLDLSLVPLAAEERARLLGELGLGEGPLLLGSSTWPGEEALLVEAFRALRALDPAARLLLVPRHAERREEVEALLVRSGFRFHFRSRGAAAGPVDVAVGDTTGELRAFTQLARLAVIGKSFPPHGEGQTPVEAAAFGIPALCGPGMTNFRVIVRDLSACGALEPVASPEALALRVCALWGDPVALARKAAAGRAWHAANQGALGRTLDEIGPFVGRARS